MAVRFSRIGAMEGSFGAVYPKLSRVKRVTTLKVMECLGLFELRMKVVPRFYRPF